MGSEKTWDNVFSNSLEFQNVNSFFNVLKNAPVKLQDARESEKEIILKNILNAEEGIFNFIAKATIMQDHVPKISYKHLETLSQLSVQLFKNFPEKPQESKIETVDLIKTTFRNIQQLEKQCQHEYLTSFFYQALLCSCCNTLNSDIKLQQEIQNLTKEPTCYKDYVPLWIVLFKTDDFQTLIYNQELFNKFLLVSFDFLKNLNLNISSELNTNKFKNTDIAKAESKEDFRFFINFVDLFNELISQIDIAIIQYSVETLLTYFIKCSYEYPMVSGFYKVIYTIFKKLTFIHSYESCCSESSLKLIFKYLLDVLGLINDFSDELQLSCIHLIIYAPLEFVEKLVDETIFVFDIALKIGLNDFSIAFSTLDTLETWSKSLENSRLSDFTENIIPYLEPYLNISKHNLHDKKILQNLHRKVLLYYGDTSFAKVEESIHQTASQVTARWQKTNQFSCKMEFVEMKVELNLEKIINRTVILSRTASSRSLRLSACELLHGLVTLSLGRRSASRCLDKDSCLAVLRLGCDTDWAVRCLHRPLALQLCRYYAEQLASKGARPAAYNEPGAAHIFFDLLLDGATQVHEPRLRGFCVTCLLELAGWSAGVAEAPMNFAIHRLRDLLLDPLPHRRLYATILFNRLCPVLGTNKNIINIYWLDFLCIFVRCLEIKSNSHVLAALDNIVKVIRSNSDLLISKCKERKVLFEINENLNGTIIWLFEGCGFLNDDCREKCMDMLESLCDLVPPYKSVRDFVLSIELDSIHQIALKDLDDRCCEITFQNAKAFLKSLEFYSWILRKRFLPPDVLLQNKGKMSDFFNFYSDFISVIVDRSMDDILKESTNSLTEIDELQDLINKCIMEIFGFLLIILQENNINKLLKNFWTNNLYTMISRFVLCPNKIGTSAKTLQFYETQQLEIWFLKIIKEMNNKLPLSYVTKLQESLFAERKEHYDYFMEMDVIINSRKDVTALCYFVRGITILQRCKFLDFKKKLQLTADEIEKKIIKIFETYKSYCVNGATQKKIGVEIKNYSIDLINFFLVEYEPQLVEFIANLILSTSNNSNFTNGFSFEDIDNVFHALKAPMFKYLLINCKETLSVLEDHPDKLFFVIENLLRFSQQNQSSINSVNLVEEVIERCEKYKTLVGEDERRHSQFFEINRLAISMRSENKNLLLDRSNNLYNWILEEWSIAKDTDHKLYILDNFFAHMVNSLSAVGNEIGNSILRGFWNEDVRCGLDSNEISERLRAHKCMSCLLVLLTTTRSPIVLEAVVEGVAVAAGRYFSKASLAIALQTYFGSLSKNLVNEALSALFKVFMDEKRHKWEARLDLLEKILIPAVETCDKPTFKHFYETHVCDLVNVVDEELSPIGTLERKQSLVTRTGYFRITELALSKIKIDRLEFYVLSKVVDIFIDVHADDERELARLLNCSVLNCLIAAELTQTDREVNVDLNMMFDVDIWERIIDCQRSYDVNNQPKGFCARRISVPKQQVADQLSSNLDTYFHAYNPIKLKGDQIKTIELPDAGDHISLEDDALNEHECMPMLTTLINKLAKETQIEVEMIEISPWLRCFFEALINDKINVSLFVIRLLINVRHAMSPYLSLLFEDLARVIKTHLENNPLNYLIRHMSLMMSESVLELEKDTEVEIAQALVEKLFERAPDSNTEIYECNVFVIEKLVKVWNRKLKIFQNLENVIKNNEDLAVRMILVLFRHNVGIDQLIKIHSMHKLIRKLIFKWKEPMTPRIYEIIGWILKFIEDGREVFIKNDLVELLEDMQSANRDICVSNLYLVYKNCPSIVKYNMLREFMNPNTVNDKQRKLECYEMLMESINDVNDAKIVYSIIEFMDILNMLCEQESSFLDIGIAIITKLVDVLECKQLQPYLEVLEEHTNPNTTLIRHRKAIYEVFIDVYFKKSKIKESGNNYTEYLINLCKKVLVSGLVDPCEEIHNYVLKFWEENTELPSDLTNRLFYLLKMFDVEIHSSYAQFLCTLMLELAVQTPSNRNFVYKAVGEQPTHEQEIAIPRLSSSASQNQTPPLFAPSLAGLLNQAAVLHENELEPDEKAILETLTKMSSSTEKLIVPDSPVSKLSKRFLPGNKEHAIKDQHCAYGFIDNYKELVQKELTQQNDLIKFKRNCKSGIYPDVEITQMDVILILQEVARRDQNFANELVVLIICAVARYLHNSEMYVDLLNVIAETCDQAFSKPNDFVPVAMEMLQRLGCKNFNAENVTQIAILMNLQFSGTLLLEKSSIHCDQYIHKVTGNQVGQIIQHGKELIRLYQSLGENEVVQSILKNWMNPVEMITLSQGFQAEIQGDWNRAKEIYESICDSDPAEDFCSEGLLRCLSELSSWDQLNIKLADTLDLENCNNIWDVWDDPKKKKLLPWSFKGHLQKFIEDLINSKSKPKSQFLKDMSECLPILDFKLPKVFAEELSYFYLCKKNPSVNKARQYYDRLMETLRDEWLNSNPLDEKTRLKIFARLERASDLNAHLTVLSSKNMLDENNESDLIDYWVTHSPNIEPRLFDWNIRVNYRLAIVSVIEKMIDDINMDVDNVSFDSQIQVDLLATSLQQRLRLSKLALYNNNREVARKHLYKIRNSLDQSQMLKESFPELQHEFLFVVSWYKFSCGEVEQDFQRKFDYYSEAWLRVVELMDDMLVGISMKIKTVQHLSQINSALHQAVRRDPKYAYLLLEKSHITQMINAENLGEVEVALWNYQIELLKTICNEGDDKTRADNWLRYAAYCYEQMLESYDRTSYLQNEFIKAVLTAMTYGNLKATRYFTALLKSSIYESNENHLQTFSSMIQAIPTKMFLTSQDQIFSQLATPLGSCILPIVEKLVQEFPSATMYKFKEIYTSQPDLQNEPAMIDIHKSLFNEKLEAFFKALEYLCQPEQYFKYHLSKIIDTSKTSKTFFKALPSLENKIFLDSDNHNGKLKSTWFQQICNKYREKIRKLNNINEFTTLKNNIKKICSNLEENMLTRLNSKSLQNLLLESYSPFLSNFSFEDLQIEVPGQKNQRISGTSRDSIKIARINSFVDIVASKRSSLKISIIGTNGKMYEFLVKCGTDLRSDERIQQLLENMNDTLRTNVKCATKHLIIPTYNVIPMSDSLAFVQWIKNAKSLKEYIEFTANDKIKNVSKNYQTWIDQATNSRSLFLYSQFYKQAMLKYGSEEVEKKMKELTTSIDWDFLRKTFVKITTSIDCFYKLRRNFIVNYAVMCTADWIVGVGDRRLENILIEATTGKCFGIDLAIVFGNGADLPIPELVPFRLTAQILGLMRPFTANDLFETIMCHVIAALRSEKNLILPHLNLILHENLNWNKLLNERWQQENKQHKEIAWSPNFKFKIIQKKLNGDKPSNIMVDELLHSRLKNDNIDENDNNGVESQYCNVLKAVVMGNETEHFTSRSLLKDHDLTPEEQVQCLIDQAADVNVLGRMWVEWCPFV